MAYKPKYARKPGTQNTAAPRAARQETTPGMPDMQRSGVKPAHKAEPKPEAKASARDIVLGLIMAPLSLLLSGVILLSMVTNVGRPKVTLNVKAPDAGIMDQLGGLLSEQLYNSQLLLRSTQQEQVEIAPIKKIYTLDNYIQVAPEPNQTLFGQSSDPAEIQKVIDAAADLLEGQELYFDVNRERFSDGTVRYYLDETIFVLTWKEVRNGGVYTFSEVKIAHASQFQRHLSDNAYGSGKTYLPTEMAATVNAVVASSGDFYSNRKSYGVVVHEGKVRRIDDKYAETCFIDDKGDLIFGYMGQLKSTANAQAYVDENNIRFSLAFGPILVDNYEAITDRAFYGVGEIFETYARAALSQMGELHYLLTTANLEGGFQHCPTVKEFALEMQKTGCIRSYCLDGGQTAAIVMNDQLINRPAKGEQRSISDIIYFATAIPEGG